MKHTRKDHEETIPVLWSEKQVINIYDKVNSLYYNRIQF